MNVSINSTLKGEVFARRSARRDVGNGKTFLFERTGGVSASDAQRAIPQNRLTAYGAYCSMSSKVGNQISLSILGVQMSATPKKTQNDKYVISVHTEEGVKGHWCIRNKDTGKDINFDPKYTSIQEDPQTGKKYLISSDRLGGFVEAWGVDSSMEELLREFMGVDDIKCADITEKYTVDRHSLTGIVSIKRRGAEGNGASIIIEDEEQEKKLEELTDLYQENYPSLMANRKVARATAELEVIGYAVRDDDGILTIGIGGMVYMNEKNPEKGWGIMFSKYDSTIYSKIKEALGSQAITGNQVGDHKKWEKWLTEKGVDFECSTFAEDNEQDGKQESEIVIMPDGSRVLVTTVDFGGVKTTMSLEISKPTVDQNDDEEPKRQQEGQTLFRR